MEPNPQDYHSYLLRLWRVRDDGQRWRASLEDVRTRELCAFAEFKDLVRYLEAITAQDVPQPAARAEQEVSGR